MEWLNHNSGAMQFFLVLALFAATGAYAYFNFRQMRESRKQREILARQLTYEQEAVLTLKGVAALPTTRTDRGAIGGPCYWQLGTVHVVVSNRGRGVARNVKSQLSFSNHLIKDLGIKETVGPGERCRFELPASAVDFFNKLDCPKSLDFDLLLNWHDGTFPRRYEERAMMENQWRCRQQINCVQKSELESPSLYPRLWVSNE